MKGQTLIKEKELYVKKIEWKQGSFMGKGGDKSQMYTVCIYKFGEIDIPVYIAEGFEIPQHLKVSILLYFISIVISSPTLSQVLFMESPTK